MKTINNTNNTNFNKTTTRKGEIKMIAQNSNSGKIKNLKKGNNTMKTNYLFNSAIKSCLILLFIILSYNIHSQFIKFYDYPPLTTSFSHALSIEKQTVPDAWTLSGYSNSTSPTGTKWLFQKMDAGGSVIYTTLLGDPTPVGSQTCWSHALLVSPPDFNVLAGVYKGSTIAYDELLGDGAFTILSSAGDPVLTKKVGVSPPFTISTWRQVISGTDGFELTGAQIFNPSSSIYIPKVIAAKYSPSGSLIWGFRYNPASDLTASAGHSICLAGDGSGDYYVAGQVYLGASPGMPYVLVMKLTPSGTPIWTHAYLVPTTPTEYSNAFKIIGLPDGDAVIAGSTSAHETSSGYRDIWLFRIHPDGSIVWSKTYGTPSVNEEATSVAYESSDASLMFTGYIMGTADGHSNLCLGKTDASTGTLIWLKYCSNTEAYDRGTDIKEFSGSRLAGYNHSSGTPTGASRNTFIKTDLSGSAGVCLISTSLPVLTQDAQVQQIQDMFMPLTDSTITAVSVHTMPSVSSCGTTGISNNQNEMPEEFSLSQNYPNPFNPSTKIKYEIASNTFVKLVIYDITGKEVKTIVDQNQNAGTYEVIYDASNLSSGIYFYKLTANNFSDVKKMSLVK